MTDSGRLQQANKAKEVGKSVGVGMAVALAAALLSAIASSLGLSPAAAILPVGISVFCIVLTLHYYKTQQAAISRDHGWTTRQRLEQLSDRLEETQGLVQLGGIGLPFPLAFGGAYALTADAAAVLAREITIRRPQVVVELGSGVSTILVGRLLQQLGCGRVYSLEHDPAWAALTRKHVAAAALDPFVEVLDAPLGDCRVGAERFTWYTLPDSIKALGAIDFLIVDGPPQRIDPNGQPRYPALPVFEAQLSRQAAVYIDDAKRTAETEMVRLWLERFPGWQAQPIRTVPGTCVLVRG